jgi:Lrp/AsnC family transcriptional regulator, leucine-responsive regulatory protein
MDKLDYQILAELHKDGSMSYVDIAKNVNTTPNKVRRRYEKMKQDGIIFCSTAVIDLGSLGYQGKTFIMINLLPGSDKAETIKHIIKIKNVFGVSEVIGPCDLVAIAFSTDLASIQTLLAEAKKAPNIQKVDFYCIDDTYFPLTPNLNELLNQKSREIADTL